MIRAGLRQGVVAIGLLALPAAAGAAVLLGSPARLAVDGSPLAVALSDVDADGALDVITANESGGDGPSLSVVHGRGDGSFAAEERLNLDPSRYLVQSVVGGDFDADGKGDVAVAVDDLAAFPPHASLLVYLNDGNGQFGRPSRYGLDGLAPRCLASADVDGDGTTDLVTCMARASDGGGWLALLAGDGKGTFGEPRYLSAGFVPAMIEIDDLDRDGYVDLVVGDAADPQVQIFFGAAAGFTSAVALPIGAVASAVRVVVDADGVLPLLVVTSAVSSEIQIFAQTTARDLRAVAFTAVDDAPTAAIAVDLDRDGSDELVTLSAERGRIVVYEVSPEGCQRLQRLTTAALPSSLAVADFDADGRPDIAIAAAGADAAEVFLNGRSPVEPQLPTATASPTDGLMTPTPVPSVAPPTPAAPTATSRPSFTATPVVVVSPPPTATVAAPLPTVTATATPAPQPGDANCDGRVDDADVAEMVWQMFRPYCDGADVNGDGKMSAADIILLMELLEPAS